MEDRLFDPTPTLSVSEVLTRAQVVVERAFGEEVWIEGEIQNLPDNRSPDTHLYFDIVESREDGRVAGRLPVVLFAQNRRGVNALLRRSGGKLRMADGLNVRIRGSVTAYERTGQVQLRMTAIDPNHTVGLLAAERDRVMEALAKEGLLAANGRRPLVGPPLRVTVLTSRGSAAAEDFLHELGASGLGFEVTLVDVRVQGRDAEPTIVAALAAVEPGACDVVALVRGGGARTDLAAFDAEGIARAIAGHPGAADHRARPRDRPGGGRRGGPHQPQDADGVRGLAGRPGQRLAGSRSTTPGPRSPIGPSPTSTGPTPGSTGPPAGRWCPAGGASTGPTSATGTWPTRSGAAAPAPWTGPTSAWCTGPPRSTPTTPPAPSPGGGPSPGPPPVHLVRSPADAPPGTALVTTLAEGEVASRTETPEDPP